MPERLALHQRPKTIDQVIGQEHLVGPGKIHCIEFGSQSSLYDTLRTSRPGKTSILQPSLELSMLSDLQYRCWK